MAVLLPSCVVTVILAVPAETAVTNPDEFTVATAVLLELHVTVLLVAFAGAIVADSCCVFPVYKLAVVGETLTEATGIAATVMAEVAVYFRQLF